MKVIVFGGSGFLGSHVADALSDAGHEVVVYDMKSSPYLKASQHMIVGDILDQAALEASVRGCEVVYNFAGIADIDEARQKPLESVRSNILGNTLILEACRKAGVKRFVFASSLYVYSRAGAFYRSTKQACELLIENYFEVFDLAYTILRYGSLYGPRADERNFISKIIRQALVEGRITRYGDGEELRDYIHVLDAAKGSVEILADEFRNQHIILTGHQRMKVKDVLLMIKEMLENKVEIQFMRPENSVHYEITPYAFAPRVGKRLTSRTYMDLGQGILDMIYETHRMVSSAPTCNGLIVPD